MGHKLIQIGFKILKPIITLYSNFNHAYFDFVTFMIRALVCGENIHTKNDLTHIYIEKELAFIRQL